MAERLFRQKAQSHGRRTSRCQLTVSSTAAGNTNERPAFEALGGKIRKRAFDGLVVVVVTILSMGKLIGRAPRKKRHRHVEPRRTQGSD